MHFPANQLGGPKKVWTITEYGLSQVWVKAETTVVINAFQSPFQFMSLIRIPFSISLIWAVHTIITPQQTPEAKERVEPIGLEVAALPYFLKVGHFTL